MAGIRKTDTVVRRPEAPPLAPTTTTSSPSPPSPAERTELVADAFAGSALRDDALPALVKALEEAGPEAAALRAAIERQLRDSRTSASAAGLDRLASAGVDVTAARHRLAARADATTSTPLGQTSDKTVADAPTGQQASANAADKHAAIQASHAGRAVAKNELSPEFKLAKQLTGEIAGRIWSDKAPPELKAVADAIGPQVSSLAQQTAVSVMADPNAMANLTQLMTKVGKEGFAGALSSSTRQISEHFLTAAGVQAKNPEAIKTALAGVEKLAPSLGHSLGPKIAETASKLSARLVGEGAQAATTAATTTAKAATATAGAATATIAAKAAATGSKALPLVGNVVSMGSALLAGATLLSQLTKKPRDVEKILKEGVNALTQSIGVAFPWVALGGTLVDSAWSAKTSVSDQKKQAQGIPVTDNADVLASLPLLTDSAEILQSVLRGAGKTDAAEKVSSLVATTKTMATLDLNKPGDRLSLLRKDEQEALLAMAHETKGELDDASVGERDGSRKDALKRLAHGFGALADTTLATMRFDKQEGRPGFDDQAKKDLVVKRNELASALVRQLSELGLVELERRQGATAA